MANVISVDGSKKDGVQVQNAIAELRNQLPLILEIAKLKSEYQKERMVAMKREGFTEEQAIEVIKVEQTPFDQ